MLVECINNNVWGVVIKELTIGNNYHVHDTSITKYTPRYLIKDDSKKLNWYNTNLFKIKEESKPKYETLLTVKVRLYDYEEHEGESSTLYDSSINCKDDI